MATIAPPMNQTDDDEELVSALTPLAFPPDYTPGKYASFYMSPEPIYGPDELGDYKSAVDDMTETVTRADSAARIWEVMQAWELRLFVRNYQFLNSGWKGWGLYGGGAGGATNSGQAIMQAQNAGRLFSCNVIGAREDKIVAALAREVPGLTFVAKRDSDPMDQTAADEAKKYMKVWLNDAGIKNVVGQTASLFYTDDRVVLFTGSWANEQEWGTETPDEQQESFDAPNPEGISPETEMQPEQDSDKPAVRELTKAFGKLECKVPIYSDEMCDMPWIRIATEQNVNILKERYPWIEDKITAGAAADGGASLDRMARINVRLAVQTSSSSGESWQQDATESMTWYRPSQYRSIKNKDMQKVFRETFPDGLLVVHAGSELAFIRNESMNKHLTILHPRHGSGQNRRAIGSNYLPLQKILNGNLSLQDRTLRNAIARRFAEEPYIDTQAINTQANDPAKITPVTNLPAGKSIADITGIENVPQPNMVLLEFIQWLINGAPEMMDGAAPAMFGAEDADTFGATKLNRDQALQVFSLPWSQICMGLAKAAEQAVECAAQNRVANIASNVPGQGKLQVEIEKLQGNALCYPESMEIPQTIAEQEAQMADLLENGQNVAIYQAIANSPRNLTTFSKFPSLSGLDIPGLQAVEQQDGELELLMQSGPLDNPQIAQMQMALQQGANDPEAQSPQGQEMMQQLQQQMQSLPPKVSSVPVAQDGSENHAIHAAITLGFMEDAEGRKLKNGTPEQQAIYENIHLHWQEHEKMVQQLTPVKPLDVKASATVAIDKLPPNVQAQALQAMGVQAMPADFEDANELVPHETVVEKEGVDANGVPVKQKISMTNPGGKLS
jgi:hypothetical protein